MQKNRTIVRAAENLQRALDFLNGKDWPDAVMAAVAAEKQAMAGEDAAKARDLLTIANLLIVAAQDERPFLQGAGDAPPALIREEDKDIPF